MRVTITCKCEESADFIHETLIHPLSGNASLLGSKNCVDYHGMVPDILEFDLTNDEIAELRKYKHVKSIRSSAYKIKHYAETYNKVATRGYPMMSRPLSSTQTQIASAVVPHSLYYCQNYDANFTHDPLLNGTINQTLSSIDCSNVDIVICDFGVDKDHMDIRDNVVLFDWGQLRDSDYQYILPSFDSAAYYKDTSFEGHGTACASLAAGKVSGFAKKANIYSLNMNEMAGGYDVFTCLKLMLAFQKAKKLGRYGLNPANPTIMSNSWGFDGYTVNYGFHLTEDLWKYSTTFGSGPGFETNGGYINGCNDAADSYIRSFLDAGIHVLCAAGNDNVFLDRKLYINAITGTYNGDSTFMLRTFENRNQTFEDTDIVSYENFWNYDPEASRIRNYNSPDCGYDINKENYALIKVGDVTPIGNNSNPYGSTNISKQTYNFLNTKNIKEFKLKTDSAQYTEYPLDSTNIIKAGYTRYNSLSDSFFVKSGYSNFGPDVDIYAPGNGTWAAMAQNQYDNISPYADTPIVSYGNYFVPYTDSGNGGINTPRTNDPALTNTYYKFFNGTSAATPIVAGILATYLSKFPNSTVFEAKKWLLENAVEGNIMETKYDTVDVVCLNDKGNKNISKAIPFGPGNHRFSEDSATGYTFFGDVLFGSRFFKSSNLIAQAYPSRKTIVYGNQKNITVGKSNLHRSLSTNKNQTNYTYTANNINITTKPPVITYHLEKKPSTSKKITTKASKFSKFGEIIGSRQWAQTSHVSMNYTGNRFSVITNGNGPDELPYVTTYELDYYDKRKFAPMCQPLSGNNIRRTAMNGEGNRLVIGSPNVDFLDPNTSGCVKVFKLFSFRGQQRWDQIGNTIVGNSKYFGWTVAMNQDGNRVAITDCSDLGWGGGSGITTVYKLNGTTWSKLGQDIPSDGETSYSGFDVKINSAGDRIIIGSPYPNHLSASGNVKVYQLNTDNLWVQLGQKIEGKVKTEEFGTSVTMNDAGDRIAVSAPYFWKDIDPSRTQHFVFKTGDISYKYENYIGAVRIYQLSNNSWVQIGSDIEGGRAQETLGESLDMDGSGNRIIIGSPRYDSIGPNNLGEFYDSGKVSIYKLSDKNPKSWVKMDNDIFGNLPYQELGRNVSISRDGKRFSVGSSVYYNLSGRNLGLVNLYNTNQ